MIMLHFFLEDRICKCKLDSTRYSRVARLREHGDEQLSNHQLYQEDHVLFSEFSELDSVVLVVIITSSYAFVIHRRNSALSR
jgi:hypothetical protein